MFGFSAVDWKDLPDPVIETERVHNVEDLSEKTKLRFRDIVENTPSDLLRQILAEIHRDRKNTYSLRLIDVAVTVYANKHHSVYYTKDGLVVDKGTPGAHRVDLRASYQDQMNTHSKAYFDVFARGAHVHYQGHTFALCQFNFFKWAIRNGVLDFIAKNLKRILDVQREIAQRKSRKRKRSRSAHKDEPMTRE